jgi:hypothetical protein
MFGVDVSLPSAEQKLAATTTLVQMLEAMERMDFGGSDNRASPSQ